MNNTGRNAPCPCGSGKKHKQCCLRQNPGDDPASATRVLQTAFSLHQGGQLRRAEAMYRDVLRISPDHPDALHLLGLIARQEGNNELAVEFISKAARINPVAPIYFNLGNAYQSLGKLDEAIASFQHALALNPGYVAALNNLGIAFQHLGRLEDALHNFHKALELQPDYAELYSNLADVLREGQQTEAATEYVQKAIALAPESSHAHFTRGKILHDQGRSKEALASLRQALQLNPAHVETHLALASTYSDEGSFSAASQHIERAIQMAPNNPEACALLAFSKKMTTEDEAWARKAQLFLKGGVKPKEEIHLNYALGKYYDDTSHYDSAFTHYVQANLAQKRMHGGFDPDYHRNLVDSIIASNTKETVRRCNVSASPSKRPIFVVGMPRSGTSLTEQILASHHEIFGAGELRFWNQKAADNLSSLATWSQNIPLIKECASGYEMEMNRYSATASRIVDKMPANFMNLGLIHAAFPNARIIHMQRNPADTCLSIYFQGFAGHHPYANDLNDLAFYYREYRRLMAHWRNVLPSEVFLDVPYEGLVEEQENWSRRIIDFLGLEWDDSCLNFHETERRVGTASNWQVRQKIYKTSKARWRNYERFIGPLLPLLE